SGSYDEVGNHREKIEAAAVKADYSGMRCCAAPRWTATVQIEETAAVTANGACAIEETAAVTANGACTTGEMVDLGRRVSVGSFHAVRNVGGGPGVPSGRSTDAALVAAVVVLVAALNTKVRRFLAGLPDTPVGE